MCILGWLHGGWSQHLILMFDGAAPPLFFGRFVSLRSGALLTAAFFSFLFVLFSLPPGLCDRRRTHLTFRVCTRILTKYLSISVSFYKRFYLNKKTVWFFDHRFASNTKQQQFNKTPHNSTIASNIHLRPWTWWHEIPTGRHTVRALISSQSRDRLSIVFSHTLCAASESVQAHGTAVRTVSSCYVELL